MMVSLFGWTSSLLFAICAVPQAYICYKQGHGRGLSKTFLWIWLWAEIFYVPYIYLKFGWDWPIMSNIIANLICMIIIMRYIYWPKQNIK